MGTCVFPPRWWKSNSTKFKIWGFYAFYYLTKKSVNKSLLTYDKGNFYKIPNTKLRLKFNQFIITLSKHHLSYNSFTQYITSTRLFTHAANNNNLGGIVNCVSNNNTDANLEKFCQWFVGLSDAESNFIIVPQKIEGGDVKKFNFRFTIGLHVDDYHTLIKIQNKLNIGRVSVIKDECKFIVSKQVDIKKLITIFDKYPLFTSKILDYLDFKKAFTLYYKREGLVSQDLKDIIIALKNGMNTLRTNFNMPSNHVIEINKYWLLGFIEGEGSFHLWRKDLTPVFAIQLIERQLSVLQKIKEYLINSLGFDTYSLYKLQHSSSIAINHQKARNNSKASELLLIKNIHILHNYFIPFFNHLEFNTKKYKDFLDFKIICKAVYCGAHKKSQIKSLILKLSLTMNNNRLSTNSKSIVELSPSERDTLISVLPSIEHLRDGRQRDIITNKIIHQHTSCVYEIIQPNGNEVIKLTLGDAALIVNVDLRTLSKYLDVNEVNDNNGRVKVKDYYVKRVAVFYNKK